MPFPHRSAERRLRSRRAVPPVAVVAVAVALILAACGSSSGSDARSSSPSADQPSYEFPPAPPAEAGALDDEVARATTRLAQAAADGGLDRAALSTVAESGDARLGWLFSDLLRFTSSREDADRVADAFTTLTSVDPSADPAFADSPWQSITNHLIAWDLPAPPDYRQTKAIIFLAVEPGWQPFFDDADSAVDWRLLSWGGVGIDDRPLGDTGPCSRGCIPALDDPATTDAAGGDWYPDDATVFGITEGSDALALPKNIMEVHEMTNLTLGGRRLTVPYCTLCGAAQAYYTDGRPDGDLVLRTSGLLSRSNKVMYELGTRSVFDTFTGEALSGPLHDEGLTLESTSVIVSTWGDWKTAHPDTRIVAEDGGIGRTYDPDPLGGRDDDGPIFPTGPVDPRLPIQAQVVGVLTADGTPVAFDAGQARRALDTGRPVEAGGVTLEADGSGFRATATDDAGPLASNQAFWFAWSQFHPDTVLWTPTG